MFDPASGNKECTYTYSSNVATNGTFSTPGYPKSYPPNTRCRFRFRARFDQVIWILWSDFHLEGPLPHQRCLHDYVEVIVIDRQNVQHISGRYCGSRKPPDFRTMQQAVDIIFQSSFIKHFQGFSGSYMFINEREVQPPMSRYPGKSNPHSIGCGGFAQGTYGGVIKSPEYPLNYPADVECNWIIRVRSDKQIFIKILELQLTPGFQCEDAQLDVFDGYAHYNPGEEGALSQSQRVRFCGEEKYYREEGDKSYMSDRNRIHIRFKTTKGAPEQMKLKRQEFGSAIGFYLVWTEVSIDANCASFYCRGGEYCIDEGKSICAERKRYCIDNSLVCDGIPNCAEFDNSDEESCYSKELLVSGVCLLVLLVLLIVIVVHWQRCRGRKLVSQLIHGSASSHRHPLHEASALTTEHKEEDGFLGAKPLRNSLKSGPKSIEAVTENHVQSALPGDDKSSSTLGAIAPPAYKRRGQNLDADYELRALTHLHIPAAGPPSSCVSCSPDDDSGGQSVWKQRHDNDADSACATLAQPLITSLGEAVSRPRAFKSHKLPKCILKSSQSSSLSSEASDMGGASVIKVPSATVANAYQAPNRLARVDNATLERRPRSLRRAGRQKVEFSDIVTVRLRPAEEGDEEKLHTVDSDHKEAGAPVDHRRHVVGKAMMKPTVV